MAEPGSPQSEIDLEESERFPVPSGYDIFVLLLSILSMSNVVLMALMFDADVMNVILIVDGITCLVFLTDFFLRLYRAPSKRGYFINDKGWLDLIGSFPVPGLRLARLYRIKQVSRSVRHYGMRGIAQTADDDRAGSSLLVAMFLTIVVLQFGSMAILRTEKDAQGANIQSASDAMWWSYVSITTVGYGDRYPVTNLGRGIGVCVLTIGVGLFGVLTGFLANTFLAPKRAHRRAPGVANPDLKSELDQLRALVAELRTQVATSSADSLAHGSPGSIASPYSGGRPNHERT